MSATQGPMNAPAPWHNLLEPARLVEHFIAHPPEGFRAWVLPDGTPAFSAFLDPLLTADDATQRRLRRLPWAHRWRRWLRMRTCFVGSTVSEYAVLSRASDAAGFVRALATGAMRDEVRSHTLTIVKDLPVDSPLLDRASNAHAAAVAAALSDAGFALLAGQALAFVPVQFASTDQYLARFSAARRKDIRRKLRSRRDLQIDVLATGPAFADLQLRACIHRLYRNVYDRSTLQFDRLTSEFFDAVLTDAELDGRVFLYRHDGRLIGFNLCVVFNGALVDKYVGFEYPAARRHNLYCVSWMQNLDYAAANGLSHFIAGCAAPAVKADLGATFTFTRHAVYARNALLRAALRRVAGRFEGDRTWFEGRTRAADSP